MPQGGNPGDGQRPSYRLKTVSRFSGWGWPPVFTGVTIAPAWRNSLRLKHVLSLACP